MAFKLVRAENGPDPLAALWEPPSAHPYTRFPFLGILNPKTTRKKAVAITEALGSLDDGAIYGMDLENEKILPAEGKPLFVLNRWRFFAEEESSDDGQSKRLHSVTEERKSESQKEFNIVALLHVLDDGYYCTVSKLTGAQSRFARDIEKEQVRASSPLGLKRLAQSCPAACDPGFPPRLRVMGTVRGDCSNAWIILEADKIGPVSNKVLAVIGADSQALADALGAALAVFEERCAFFRSLKPKSAVPLLGEREPKAIEVADDDEIPF